MEVIGISSNPGLESVIYPNGDCIQYFTIEFYAKCWEGTLKPEDKDEVTKVAFQHRRILAQLPENERLAFQSLDYYRLHGKILLK